MPQLVLLTYLALPFAEPFAASQACSQPCVSIVDYQHDNSPLSFIRTQVAIPNKPGLQQWRHNYQVVLTQSGTQRTVFDTEGQKHVFQLISPGHYQALQAHSGQLTLKARHYAWTDSSGVRFQFSGSLPVFVTDEQGRRLTLSYSPEGLSNIEDEHGNQLGMQYQGRSLSALLLPDGTRQLLRNGPEQARENCDEATAPVIDAPQDSPPDRCDTQANPVPGFDAIPTDDFISTLDARPGSCASYFVDYYGTDRGDAIENGLALHAPYSDMTATVHSFPIVDFYDDEQWLVVVSRDLASPTFNNLESPDALLNRLMRDGEQINTRFLIPLSEQGEITVTELGHTSLIEASEHHSITLQVVIRQGMASPAHWRQINQARERLWQQYGIRLEIVIIP